ncbi:hypothetical protein Trydic_g11744 [Trypoxylus dichotomus]
MMKHKNVTATKCKLIQTGIQVQPATEDDYRKLSKMLKEEGIQFYTFQLKSEKKLKVVLRGITQDITDDEIKDDLQQQDYPVEKNSQMKGRNGQPTPLVLIEVSREYKSIYNIANCCGLAIKVEPLLTHEAIVTLIMCMKCGEGHSTHLCIKPKTTPPKCANCQGEHLSTYIKCPANPNNAAVNKKFIDFPPPKVNACVKNRETTAMKNETEKRPATEDPVNRSDKFEEKLAVILARMVLNFNNTNATTEQRLAFLQETEELTKLEKRRAKEDDPPSIESQKNPSETLKISSEISEIKSILVGLSEQKRGVVQSQQFLSAQYDDIKSGQDRIGSQLKQVEKRMGEIMEREKVRDTEIEELSRRIALLEQGGNDRKLELHGVDEIPGVNIEEIIFEIANKLEIKLESSDLESIYRVNNKQRDQSRPVLVQFVSRKKCTEFKEKKRTILINRDLDRRDSKRKIYIYEYLSNYHKRLLWDTKQYVKKNGFRYVWVQNGKILIRRNEGSKIYQIQQNADLNKINDIRKN